MKKHNYIIYNKNRGELLLEDITEKEVLEKIEYIRTEIIKNLKENLKKEQEDLKYFYEGQYDKMDILDRPYFLENGEWGLKQLERATKEGIKHYKKRIKEYQDKNAFRIYREI